MQTREKRSIEDIVQQMESAARKINIPTLIVRGSKSELVDESRVKSLLELIPHAEYTDIKGAHLMVAGDNNDAFNLTIKQFLRQLN